MMLAKDPIHTNERGEKAKLSLDSPSEIAWAKLLAKDGLIEIQEDDGITCIEGLTAKGELILEIAPDREVWSEIVGPIIEAGDSISLKSIDDRRWYRRLFRAIREWLPLIQR